MRKVESEIERCLVFGRGIAGAGLLVFFGVFAGGFGFHRAGIYSQFCVFFCYFRDSEEWILGGIQIVVLGSGDGEEIEETHETRFCVHSRSLLTSFASAYPSASLALVLASRCCANCCNSSSSLFLAFSRPDLSFVTLVSSSR